MLQTQQNLFGVTRSGIPIDEYLLPKSVNVDIVIPRSNNIVPEYEEREAAVYCYTDWLTWQNMSWYDRAAAIAQYRTHHLIEAHMNDAEQKAATRASKKRGK